MTQVDSLGIQISAEASKAAATLDSLIGKLDKITSGLSVGIKAAGSFGSSFEKEISKINKIKFDNNGLSNFVKGVSSLAKVGTSNINLDPVVKGVRDLSGVKFEDKSIQSVISSISKLAKADASNVNLGSVVNGLKDLNSVKFDNAKIQQTINAITRLSNTKVSSIDFASAGKGLADMLREISTAPDVQKSTVSITSAFASLARQADKMPIVSANLSSMGTALKDAIRSMSGAGYVSENIIQFTSAFAKLAGVGDKAAATASNLSTLGNGLKNVFSVLSTAPQVSDNTVKLTQAIGNIAISGTGANKATKALSNTLNNYSANANKGSKSSMSLAVAMGKIFALYRSIVGVLRSLGKSIEKSMDFGETVNYFEKAMGQVTEKADLSSWKNLGYESSEAYANSFSERAKELTAKMTGFNVGSGGSLTETGTTSLGIDPDLLMQYQATFGQMASSIGVSSDNAILLSNALTMIGADLASVRNMDFADVWDNLRSGLTGATEAVDKYGINIRDASMQQKLAELGIKTSISALSQQDKALLRTIMIIESSSYSWGDLADTLNQPSNQLRLLKTNFSMLGKTIGDLFLPVLSKILPIANAVTIVLQRLFMAIGNVFGIQIKDYSEAVGSLPDAGMGDFADNVESSASGLGDAASNAKKLSRNLSSLDEFNVISTESSSSGGGGGAGGGGSLGAGNLELNQAFLDAMTEYQKAWDEAFGNMENKAQGLADVLTDIAKFRFDNLASGFEFSFEFDSFDKLKQNLQGLSDVIKDIFSDESVLSSITGVITEIDQTFGAFAGTVTSLSLSFATGFTGGVLESFTESMGFIQETIESVSTNLQKSLDKFQNLSKAISIVGKAFEGEGFQNIIAFLSDLTIYVSGNALDNATGLFSDLFDVFASPFIENAENWRNVIDGLYSVVSEVTEPLRNFITTLMGNDKTYQESPVHGFLEEFAKFKSDGVGIVLSAISDGIQKALETIQNVKKALGEVGPWINTNVVTPVVGFFKGLWEDVSGFFVNLWEDIKGIWETVSGWFDENVVQPVVGLFEGVKKRVVSVFEGMWIIVKAVSILVADWFDQNVVQPIVGFFEKLREDVSGFFTSLWEDIKAVWNKVSGWFDVNVVQPVAGFFSDLWTDVSGYFSDLWEDIKEVWATVSGWFDENVLTPVSSAFETACDGIQGFFDGLWAGIKNGIKGAMNSVIGAIETSINWIINGINKIIMGFNKVVSWAAKVAETDWGGVDKIPTITLSRLSITGYEHGGFPEPASLFYAGEHGVPELLGTVGGKTAVAGGAEITGIRQEIRDTANEEMLLLREQNSLLRELISKDFSTYIGDREIAKASNRGNAMLGRQLITV